MKRADRLLAIVLELQARRQVRAEDLADFFEVSKRTIYRDMMALDESGVPILSLPGQGYSLVEGYFLPPLTFRSDEALMLILGSGVAAQNFDAQYRHAAQSASSKIVSVLPEALRQEVEYLQENIQFMAMTEFSTGDTLYLLRQALLERRTVRFRYHARLREDQSSADSLREADPYALVHIAGTWMLAAYCHLRHDRRHFRLDRMDDVTLTTKTFERPRDFILRRGVDTERVMTVRALLDHEAARWAGEAPSYFQVTQEAQPDGVLLTFRVRQVSDVLNWLLGWGAHVRVIEPESLREMMAREAAALLQNHQA